jgi:RNA polymerase sigma factor (sigma-70 family)
MSNPNHQPSSLFAEMMMRVQTQDKEAFVSLIAYFEGIVRSYLKHQIGDNDIADDLWSEVVLRAWRSLPDTDEGLTLEPKARKWFFTTATNLVYNHYRNLEHLHPISLEYIEELCQCGDSQAKKDWKRIEDFSEKGIDEMLCESERILFEQGIIDLAVKHVSPQYLVCFHMKYVKGISHQKIAQSLGISESCSRSYACRGRKQFFQAVSQVRTELEREDA